MDKNTVISDAIIAAEEAGRAVVRFGANFSTIKEVVEYFDHELAYGFWDDIIPTISIEQARDAFIKGVLKEQEKLK